jgi:hypothetical protein
LCSVVEVQLLLLMLLLLFGWHLPFGDPMVFGDGFSCWQKVCVWLTVRWVFSLSVVRLVELSVAQIISIQQCCLSSDPSFRFLARKSGRPILH